MQTRKVVLSPLAESDLANVAAWTASNFGVSQASAYVDAIIDTIEELAPDEKHPRSRERHEIIPGLRSLHMAKRSRHGRHLILYLENRETVTILRILHDSMELARHLPETSE